MLSAVFAAATLLSPIGASAQDGDGGGLEEVLEQEAQGAAAVEALGDQFDQIARQNERDPAELRQLLLQDDSAWIDITGQLFYVDPIHDEPAASAEEIPTPQPLSNTFKLHSLPGANRVIYLDFDGHEAAGSIWANGRSDTYAEPWSQDGDASSFNDAERRLIQDVWRRVAADFAPFAVDVTTENPGTENIRRTDTNDQRFGTRVAFSPNIIYNCNCGGVAYVGVYDNAGRLNDGSYSHDYYQPAWVVASAERSAKTLAEAATHEAGHNLSLNHDGTSQVGYYQGHGDWAPIMGVGYYRPISQWSKGEYADANNTEDDLAAIVASGAPLRSDDHGGSVSSGTTLSSTSVNVEGVIESRGDVDAFTFTTSGGQVSVQLSTVADGAANLDASLKLVNSSGSQIAYSNPSGLTASISQSVGAGTYAIIVDGVAAGSPSNTGYSDYGSLGFYTLTGSVPGGGGGGGGGGSCGGLSQQAEAGTLYGAFRVGNDGAASGGQYVHAPEGSGSSYSGADSSSSRVDYCFNVTTAGTYRIDGKVYGSNNTSDSFYVRVDGGPSEGYLWDSTQNTSYQTDSVSDRGGANPVLVTLSAGEHTISVHNREDGTRLDTISLVAAGGGGGGSCGGLNQQAENGTRYGSFRVGNDAAASGGKYVVVPTGTGDSYSGADSSPSRVEYCFNVTTAGTYRIDGKVYGSNNTSDSFYVRVDGGPSEGYLWDSTQNLSYQTDSVSDRGGANPVLVTLSAGEHTVAIHHREDGTRLDTINLVRVGS